MIDVVPLLAGSRWEILQHLAKRPRSTSALAQALGTSQANISQQLKQLEIAGFVTRERSEKSGQHYTYHITTEFTHLIHVGPRTAQKRTLSTDLFGRFLLAVLLHRHATAILAFLFERHDLSARCTAIGVLNRETPELFIIADHVEDIRRDHANLTLHTPDGPQRMVLWSHTAQEVRDGLERRDRYFIDSLRDITLTYDPHRILDALLAARSS